MVYTTVTASPEGAGESSPLGYLSFLLLAALSIGRKAQRKDETETQQSNRRLLKALAHVPTLYSRQHVPQI
jgi:hypothetical protein